MPKQKQRKKSVSSVRIKSVKRRPTKSRHRTLRPLHKRLFLHPIFVMIFLCVSVLIIGYTYHVVAASYTVSAIVDAPLLSEGATILSPVDGDTITNAPIVVSGTCPYQSYIKLYDNTLFSGTAWCTAGGTFQITTDLYSGTNSLLAQDYNITDQPGPASPAVTLTYTPPKSPSQPTGGSSSSSSSTIKTSETETVIPATRGTTPLVLTSDFHYQTFVENDVFVWTLDVEGGIPPYAITANWGDGTSSAYNFNSDPQFQITHTYNKTGYYPIIVNSTDKVGNTRMLQLAALIRLPGNANIFNPVVGATACGLSGSSTKSGCTTSPSSGTTQPSSFSFNRIIKSFKGWMWLAWSSYLIILLMIISFWLGEREEYYHIFRKKKLNYAHKRR